MILVDHARRNRPITVINSRHEASSELVRLAARLVIEEALEGEAADALGLVTTPAGAAGIGLSQRVPPWRFLQENYRDRITCAAVCHMRSDC